MFFVAKRKRKKATKSTPARRSPNRSSSRRGFIWDHLLAIYHFLTTTVLLALLCVVGFVILKVPTVEEIGRELRKLVSDKKLLGQLNDLAPPVGISIIAVSTVLFILLIFHTRAVWQGRKWGMWLHLLIHFPGAAAAISLGTSNDRYGSIWPLIIAVFAILRLTGSVGPKLQ
jgi:hypothetical protein